MIAHFSVGCDSGSPLACECDMRIDEGGVMDKVGGDGRGKLAVYRTLSGEGPWRVYTRAGIERRNYGRYPVFNAPGRRFGLSDHRSQDGLHGKHGAHARLSSRGGPASGSRAPRSCGRAVYRRCGYGRVAWRCCFPCGVRGDPLRPCDYGRNGFAGWLRRRCRCGSLLPVRAPQGLQEVTMGCRALSSLCGQLLCSLSGRWLHLRSSSATRTLPPVTETSASPSQGASR